MVTRRLPCAIGEPATWRSPEGESLAPEVPPSRLGGRSGEAPNGRYGSPGTATHKRRGRPPPICASQCSGDHRPAALRPSRRPHLPRRNALPRPGLRPHGVRRRRGDRSLPGWLLGRGLPPRKHPSPREGREGAGCSATRHPACVGRLTRTTASRSLAGRRCPAPSRRSDVAVAGSACMRGASRVSHPHSAGDFGRDA